MKDILIPIGIFAAMGVLVGIALAIASRIFAVKVDERVPQILEHLPGANCGGCGYSGCAALADAIVKGEALPTLCSVCEGENIRKIGAIMGMELEAEGPMRAYIGCSGTCHTALAQYRYEGAQDCIAAEHIGGGDKACPDGCIGLGTCVAACPYGAIEITDGLAHVDPAKCIGCGVCVNLCPKHLIVKIPLSTSYVVGCHSAEKGAITRKQCTQGCIACRICEKVCPTGAIHVTDMVAYIDQSKCTGCGACAKKCPRGIIRKVD